MVKGELPVLGTAVRFVVSALVLLLVGLLVPGFRVGGFWGALLAAVVIAFLGRALQAVLGRGVSPQGRGLGSFVLSAFVIYLSQFLVPGIRVSLVGALLAALAIGVVDAFVPTELR